MTNTVTGGRAEIDGRIFDPFSPAFIREPHATWQRLLAEFPIAYHRDLSMWIVNSHELCLEMLKNQKFTPNFRVWEFSPPPKPEAEKNDFDFASDHSLFMVDQDKHLRLRKLTMPAFSKRVMSKIDDRIHDLIVQRFDEIGTPEQFEVYSEIAAKLPVRSIARMIGVPLEDEEIFLSLGKNVVKASRINLSFDEREQAVQATLPGFAYLKNKIAERRAAAHPGDDFLGNLVSAEENGDRLNDWDIIAVINALIVAGSDTAIDLHTYLINGLLSHPDQYKRLQREPELLENALLELVRYGSFGKFPFFRFATCDIEFGGQHIRKGQAILVNLSAAWHDPRKWENPATLDITRNLDGHLVFGAGPHFCIGTYLVRVQGQIMLQEFMRRFPDATLANGNGDLDYEYTHHNARRINRLNVLTNVATAARKAA
jgi:cytochrome P450